MNHRLLRTLLLATSLGFLAGCQSVDDRIKEKPEVFAQLDTATQDKVKQGIIDLGFSEDAVYLALGKPDQRRESLTAAGKSTTWIYNTYYERYDGTRFAGYHRNVYYDPIPEVLSRLLPPGLCRHLRAGKGGAHPRQLQGRQGGRDRAVEGLSLSAARAWP
jgi:hypothetical protein